MTQPTVDSWLRSASQQLAQAGVETARLDCLVLLEDCLNTDRALLLAHPETELTAEHIRVLDAQLQRRVRHEPLAYIRGQAEFYGRVFTVDKNVLVPRPESEMMIDMLKELPSDARKSIADIGTGSGALAITAKLEFPGSVVSGVDIDPTCLAVAQQNAAAYDASVSWLRGDLWEPYGEHAGTIDSLPVTLLCNLPYVPDSYTVNQAAGHEPALALFGGSDGLDLYRRLFTQLSRSGQPVSYILTESLPEQHTALATIAVASGYTQQAEHDFIQLFHVAHAN